MKRYVPRLGALVFFLVLGLLAGGGLLTMARIARAATEAERSAGMVPAVSMLTPSTWPDNPSSTDGCDRASSVMGNQSTTIRFHGTVLEVQTLLGATRFVVRVEHQLGLPQPCTTTLEVSMVVVPACTGYIDPATTVCDRVEVYGLYATTGFGGMGCYVDLCMDGAYIKKLSGACCPCELTTSRDTYHAGDGVELMAKFCGPPDPLPSGLTVCAWVPYAQPFSVVEMDGCDGYRYRIACTTNYTDCNRLRAYAGWYVRLTDVSIEDYSQQGDPLIGQFGNIDRIASCADCDITALCDPPTGTFSMSLTAPPDITEDITSHFEKLAQG
jgi:hypothetical protein